MTRLYFKEEQKLAPYKILIILVLIIIVFLVILTIALQEDAVSNSDDNSLHSLLTASLIVIPILFLITILKLSMQLIVEIREEGICYKYKPVIKHFRTISFNSIKKYEIRKYRPGIEYRGWGIRDRGPRRKIRKNGIAYTAKGNMGLQLYLKDGKKVLIGTQRSEALLSAMDRAFKTLNKN
jgi:hypothetical protein